MRSFPSNVIATPPTPPTTAESSDDGVLSNPGEYEELCKKVRGK